MKKSRMETKYCTFCNKAFVYFCVNWTNFFRETLEICRQIRYDFVV